MAANSRSRRHGGQGAQLLLALPTALHEHILSFLPLRELPRVLAAARSFDEPVRGAIRMWVAWHQLPQDILTPNWVQRGRDPWWREELQGRQKHGLPSGRGHYDSSTWVLVALAKRIDDDVHTLKDWLHHPTKLLGSLEPETRLVTNHPYITQRFSRYFAMQYWFIVRELVQVAGYAAIGVCAAELLRFALADPSESVRDTLSSFVPSRVLDESARGIFGVSPDERELRQWCTHFGADVVADNGANFVARQMERTRAVLITRVAEALDGERLAKVLDVSALLERHAAWYMPRTGGHSKEIAQVLRRLPPSCRKVHARAILAHWQVMVSYIEADQFLAPFQKEPLKRRCMRELDQVNLKLSWVKGAPAEEVRLLKVGKAIRSIGRSRWDGDR